MADTAKRNAGRAATPKSSASPLLPDDVMEMALKAIGGQIRLTNVLGTEIKGTLYNADPIAKVVIINTRSLPPNPSTNPSSVPGDYQIVRIAAMQSFQILSVGNNDYVKQTAPTRIDQKVLDKRLESRIEEKREEKQHQGQGVGEDGQKLYDALRRLNVEVRWHGEPGKDVSQMIISNAVILDHPFEAANCRAATNKQDVLKRTKQMVDDQRKKLGLSGGIRKGG